MDWDVFISHAWEDKEAFARPLAKALEEEGLRVWYDEFTLRVGDSLRRSIDHGLANSRYGVVILSPNFFAKEWPQKELDGLAAREAPGEKVILPIWHNITADQVRKYSPTLADRVAVSSDRGLEYVVEKLLHVIKPVPEPERELSKKWDKLPPSAQEVITGLIAALTDDGDESRDANSKLVRPAHSAPLRVTVPEAVGPIAMERLQPFEPEMVLISVGEFLMGSDPRKDEHAGDEEQPQHTLYLPDYYMAKTPVTNVQYAAFVQATGHKQPEHWEGGKIPSGKEQHPVVNVSWYEAVVYCNWLSEITGKSYRLPSEAEWEKGARGSDGRIYPWGNQWDAARCSTGGRKDTTQVGAYPKGASPYGLLDMAGNVWEWTRSLWGEDLSDPSFKYPYDPADGRENLDAPGDVRRVLRGGAFDVVDHWASRCAYRYGYYPYDRYWDFGFRVMVPPGSSLDSGGPNE